MQVVEGRRIQKTQVPLLDFRRSQCLPQATPLGKSKSNSRESRHLAMNSMKVIVMDAQDYLYVCEKM